MFICVQIQTFDYPNLYSETIPGQILQVFRLFRQQELLACGYQPTDCCYILYYTQSLYSKIVQPQYQQGYFVWLNSSTICLYSVRPHTCSIIHVSRYVSTCTVQQTQSANSYKLHIYDHNSIHEQYFTDLTTENESSSLRQEIYVSM